MQAVQYVELGGWFLSVLLLATLGGTFAQGVLRALTNDHRTGKPGAWRAPLKDVGEVLLTWNAFLRQRSVGRDSAGISLGILLTMPSVSAFAAIGYAALVFVTVGVVARELLRRVAPADSLEKRTDSSD